MTEEQLKKRIGTENPFRVPEGYFEGFTSGLMEHLPEKEQVAVNRTPTMWEKIRPLVYMAAMFVGIWLMMKIFDGWGRQEPTMYNPEILAGFENDANIEYLLMRGDISEYDILTYEDDSAFVDVAATEVSLDDSNEPVK